MLIKYNTPWIIWGVLIFILMAIPGNNFPDNFIFIPFADKIVHGFLFLVFIFLLLYSFKKQFSRNFLNLSPLFWAISIALIYAGLTEILQAFCFINRTADFFDFLADCIGIITGSFLFMITRKILSG